MEFGFIFFPIWMMSFMLAFILFLFIFWLWALIACLRSNLSTHQKLFWAIIILFFHFIGALLYFLFSNIQGKNMKIKNLKGKKLLRSRKNRVIAGVCGGIGEYLGIDPTVVRLLWVVFTLMAGVGILAYIIAWIIIPEK